MSKRLSHTAKQQLVARYHNGETASDICAQSGIARSTFYTWLKPFKTTTTNSGHIVSPSEFIRMKQHLSKLEQIIEVLKKVACTSSAPLPEKLNELALLHGQYSVHVLCEALDVSRGTYYNHILRNKKDDTSYQIRRAELSEKIKEIYEDSNQIYGANKIKVILAGQGIVVSDKMVATLMREMNLYSIRTESKKQYLREKKRDHLKMDFAVAAPNQVWVSDITYFRFNKKSYYICVILDLYARKVIAYKVSLRQSTQLIVATFKLAFSRRTPLGGLIFHSDRGSNYLSHAFQSLLKSCQAKQSLSPPGRPQHNAVMESFFASLKREELYRTQYHSVEEMKKRIQQYIDHYNNDRPHATLKYKTPNAYESLFFAGDQEG